MNYQKFRIYNIEQKRWLFSESDYDAFWSYVKDADKEIFKTLSICLLTNKYGDDLYNGDICEFKGSIKRIAILRYVESENTVCACYGENSAYFYSNSNGRPHKIYTNMELLGNVVENKDLLK